MTFRNIGMRALLVTLQTTATFAFFSAPSSHHAFVNGPMETHLSATATDAVAQLDVSQIKSVNEIAAAIPDLEAKADLSWGAGSGVSINNNPATLDARDAPGNSNIAWLSSVNVANSLSSLTIFNGPLTDVPHLLSRCVVNPDNTLTFALDFRPRAYGAYEMKDAAGNYPGPETLGRDAFTYSGNRQDFDSKFGTPEVEQFMTATAAALQGTPIPASELDTLTQGPLSLHVTVPLTDANLSTIVNAREKAAQYWLKWALEDDHFHRPGAPINSQYVYDSKYRQNAYLALLPVYSAAFGAVDGQNLCAAESGPLDEGYVGGGS